MDNPVKPPAPSPAPATAANSTGNQTNAPAAKPSYNNQNASKNNNNARNIVVFGVILLLVVTNILLLFKVLDNDNTVHKQEKIITTTRVEKDALFTQLEEEKKQFEKMRTENSTLNTELDARNKEIKDKIEQISRLLEGNGEVDIVKAREELQHLRTLNNSYLEKITLLKKENKHLTQENTQLSSTLQEVKSTNETLAKDNAEKTAKMNAAAVFRADAIVVTPVKYRSSGKEVAVTKASKVQKIKVCFRIIENKLIDKGNQSIFVRVTGPDGTTWSANHETMNYKGTQMPYSLRQDFVYDNRDVDVCTLWNKGSAYVKGDYTAELYWKEQLIGTSRFSLK